MWDEDGKYSYSSVVTVTNNSKSLSEVLSVYPNPTKSTVNIKVKSAYALSTELFIVSITGSVVSKHQIDLSEGIQVISLPVGSLAQGMYYIRFGTQGLSDVKFMKD